MVPASFHVPKQSCSLVDGDGYGEQKSPATMSSPLPLGFSSTRRQATLFSSPTTKATSPDSSVVTIFRTKRCTLPWLLIWLRSLFWRLLSPSHHSPFVTPACDNSTSRTASCPVVTVVSQSSRMMRTCSEGKWDDGRSVITSRQSFQMASVRRWSHEESVAYLLNTSCHNFDHRFMGVSTCQSWLNSQSTVVLECKENTKLNYTKYYKSSKP